MWETFGIHITPNYYESPIPDCRYLKEETWSKRSSLTGVDIREAAQLELLGVFVDTYKSEYDQLPLHRNACPHKYYLHNGYFGEVDGEILYCMVRHLKPKRVYEVGSGNSTFLSAQALLENQKSGGSPAQLVAFEPSPNRTLMKGFPGFSKLVVRRVEDIPVEQFLDLEENDILFLDSSHVARVGGDVPYEFLEILPNLRPGVVVHVHDIFSPSEYPKKMVIGQRRFFSEQYLLQAFLAFNSQFEVLWAGSFIHLKHPDILEAAFRSYKKGSSWPGSFWMRRVRG